jgi:biopolymer transport protein ExbB/TolQ
MEHEKNKSKAVNQVKQKLEEQRITKNQKREERLMDTKNNLEKQKIRDHLKALQVISMYSLGLLGFVLT